MRTLAVLWINNQAPDMPQPPHSGGASLGQADEQGVVQIPHKARHADSKRIAIGVTHLTCVCTRINMHHQNPSYQSLPDVHRNLSSQLAKESTAVLDFLGDR